MGDEADYLTDGGEYADYDYEAYCCSKYARCKDCPLYESCKDRDE